MKTIYTSREVIQLLVDNNNKIMKMIDNKYFKIEGNNIVTYRKRLILPDREISRYTFDEVIDQIYS